MVGQQPSAELFESAGHEAVADAKPYRMNGFKVEMAKRAVARALANAGGMA
ncbi:MAG: hypothetical protein WDO73_34050 [Ignavibacteriota bacterium]